MGFWIESAIAMAVMILLVVLLGPGLWSSRVNIHKSDEASKDRDSGSKPGSS